MKTIAKLGIGLAILVALSPAGLLLPAFFGSKDAWGEWGSDTINRLVGYVPAGLEKFSMLWNAPLPDYGFKGSQGRGLIHAGAAYMVSALIGATIVLLIAWLIGKALSKRGD